MECPYCGSSSSVVTDTRMRKGRVRRRRTCESCKKEYITYEAAENSKVTVSSSNLKKKGFFNRQIFINSILKAAYDSPITVQEINQFADDIEFGVKYNFTTDELFNDICEFLKKRDYKAYVRYAVNKAYFVEVPSKKVD